MNPPTDPIEEALRALQPAQPSLRLATRLAADLAATPAAVARRDRSARLRQASLWLSWGVAAAMTVAYFSRTPPTPRAPAGTGSAPAVSAGAEPSEPAPRFAPVSSTNTLIGALDEGVVLLEDGRPARKVRYEYIDTLDLHSTDDSRATIRVSTPREEIRLEPVQTF